MSDRGIAGGEARARAGSVDAARGPLPPAGCHYISYYITLCYYIIIYYISD